MTIDRYVFAVLDEPYAVVSYDLLKCNRTFLRSVDAGYFEYLVQTHGQKLDSPDRQRAAIALRTAYHHGLETLFTLIGAFLQAPYAVPAWMPHCTSGVLRELLERLRYGRTMIASEGPAQLLFKDVAERVHDGAWERVPERVVMLEAFGRVWSRWASDLLDPLHQDEYNAIKHGFRVHAGGFVVRAGLEPAYGVPAPPEAMQDLGGSEFGTSFYSLQGRDGRRAGRSTREFRLLDHALNWPIQRVVSSLPLIAISINNVTSKLRLVSGEDPATLRVQAPATLEAFEEPWRYSTGMISSSMNLEIPWDEIPVASRAGLLAELDAQAAPPEVAG